MLNVIVVGSGAGGSSIARELARNGVNVTIIDRGRIIRSRNAFKCYETIQTNLEVMQTICLGGTTMVTLGNAVRTSEDAFKAMGIDLKEEFMEVEHDLKVSTLPDSHFGSGTIKLMESASSLGFSMERMPKFIDPNICKPCGECAFGCQRDAKWTSMKYLDEAIKLGAKVIEKTPITELIIQNQKVVGVKSYNQEFKADLVILCAGALNTPRILIKSGINAGEKLFVDTFVTIGGVMKKIKFNKEVPMNALIKLDDIILSPHFSKILVEKLKNFRVQKKDILGIMVKIKDESSGIVTENSVVKNNTSKDVELLSKGSAIAGSILMNAGVDSTSLVSTPPRGAHPGGTAALGNVVDENLETSISGLFVVDASVFPEAPGAPPVLTIIALAKRLAKYLLNERI
jgi:choline dehydrogenase-like flavoprotein